MLNTRFMNIRTLVLVPVLLCTVFFTGEAWSLAEKPFVAVIITGDLDRYRSAHESFVLHLRENGLTEENLRIYIQTPNPDPMSWTNSIRKAVGVGADFIVTYGAPATLRAQREARGTPVLFADVYDPVGLGIVRDIGVPVRNVAGISGKTPLETLIRTFTQIAPCTRMGVLYSAVDEGSELQMRKLADIAQKAGFSLALKDVSSQREVAPALQAFDPEIESLFITDSAVLHLVLDEVMAFAARRRLPVVSQIPGLGSKGALITLEADPEEQGQVTASLLLDILSGKQPHTLHMQTPRKVSLVINMKVAKELKLKVPFQALSAATRVIR